MSPPEVFLLDRTRYAGFDLRVSEGASHDATEIA